MRPSACTTVPSRATRVRPAPAPRARATATSADSTTTASPTRVRTSASSSGAKASASTSGPRTPAPARIAARRRRDEARRAAPGGAPAVGARQVGEQGHATLHVVDHHVLQALAEQAGERRGELGRGLDAIGDQAAQGAVLGAEQALHPGAHALQARVELLERAQAAALLAQLVLGVVDLLVADHRSLAQAAHLLFEASALLGADALALGQLGAVLDELHLAAGQLLALVAQAPGLVVEALAAAVHLLQALFEAEQGGLGAGHVGAGVAEPRAHRAGLGVGCRQLLAQAVELLVLLERQLGFARLLGLDVPALPRARRARGRACRPCPRARSVRRWPYPALVEVAHPVARRAPCPPRRCAPRCRRRRPPSARPPRSPRARATLAAPPRARPRGRRARRASAARARPRPRVRRSGGR